MTRRLRHLEAAAVGSFAAPAADLAVFRAVFAAFVLTTTLPVGLWVPLAPKAFYCPPVGPAAVFTAPPPAAALVGLNVVAAVATSALLIGWRTRTAALASGLALVGLNSWAYAFAKINHDVLLVLIPFVFAFSNWGRALSVDAGRAAGPGPAADPAWPPAVYALLVGFAMFTAGWAKVTTGWLDPDLRCTYGHLMYNYLFTGRETWAGGLALRIDSVWFWKSADWAAVGLELAFLPAALYRPWFRAVLAVATLFHLGVLLLFGISFAGNLVAYGAFVSYTRLPVLRRLAAGGAVPWGPAAVSVAASAGVFAALTGRSLVESVGLPLGLIILWAGAVVGLAYLARIARTAVRPARAN